MELGVPANVWRERDKLPCIATEANEAERQFQLCVGVMIVNDLCSLHYHCYSSRQLHVHVWCMMGIHFYNKGLKAEKKGNSVLITLQLQREEEKWCTWKQKDKREIWNNSRWDVKNLIVWMPSMTLSVHKRLQRESKTAKEQSQDKQKGHVRWCYRQLRFILLYKFNVIYGNYFPQFKNW